jgi:hypothetical protein
MTPIRRAWSLIVLVALVAILAACTPTDPRLEDEATPPTPAPTAAPAATPTAAASSAAIGSAHVALNVATSNDVTIDVTDASSSLVGATSGTPGDGASVEAYTLAVANVTPTTLRLTWVGGPCDSANQLLIDAARQRLVVVQPECPGDAIATDRVLDLEFATPVKASELETFLQDGLDT